LGDCSKEEKEGRKEKELTQRRQTGAEGTATSEKSGGRDRQPLRIIWSAGRIQKGEVMPV
jgi:hypothetical protein